MIQPKKNFILKDAETFFFHIFWMPDDLIFFCQLF